MDVDLISESCKLAFTLLKTETASCYKFPHQLYEMYLSLQVVLPWSFKTILRSAINKDPAVDTSAEVVLSEYPVLGGL